MKKFVLTAMLLAIAVPPALAQTEDLGLFADNQGLSCEITDVTAAIKRVYVVHKNSAGATASEFKVDMGASTMDNPAATVPSGMLVIGDPLAGCSIAYNECKTGTFLVMTILFDNYGTTPPCTYIRLIDDPTASPPIKQYVDCPGFAHLIVGGVGIINANGTCPCNVATMPTTWGNIKALYR